MYTFKLTEQQADIVLNALAQRPYAEVQGVIQVLVQQVQAQQKQQQAGDVAVPLEHGFLPQTAGQASNGAAHG